MATAYVALACGVFLNAYFRLRQQDDSEPPAHGLEIVANPEATEVDIVCVHNLGSSAEKTWTTDEGVTWLTDFLPSDLPSARILTFSYDSNVESSGHLFQHTLYFQARNLLEALHLTRSGEEAKRRPIIFVCHGLGGVLVKSALVQSSTAEADGDDNFKSAHLSTAGVLFVGTPQRGTLSESWGKVLAAVASKRFENVDIPVIEPIEDRSGWLSSQLDKYKSIENGFKNFSFYEAARTPKAVRHKMKSVPGLQRIISEATASPEPAKNDWKIIELDKKFFDMVRFKSRRDLDYLKLLKALRECAESYPKVRERWDHYDGNRTYSVEKQVHIKRANRLHVQTLQTTEHRKIDALTTEAEAAADESNFEASAEAYGEAVTESEKSFGYNHPVTLDLVEKLAHAYFDARDFEKAENMYRRLLMSVQAIHGPWSPRTCSLHLLTAAACQAQSHYKEAKGHLLKASEIQCALHGPNDVEYLSTCAELAMVCDRMGTFEDAEIQHRVVVTGMNKTKGPNDPSTLEALENLGLSYRLSENLVDAAKVYEEILQCRRHAIESGSGDEGIKRTVFKLAETYEEMGKSRLAKSLLLDWRNFDANSSNVQASVKTTKLLQQLNISG